LYFSLQILTPDVEINLYFSLQILTPDVEINLYFSPQILIPDVEINLYFSSQILTPDVVQADDFVQTEHLKTCVVVVPRGSQNEFLNSYESWTEDVVPRTAK
jgi:hypothetical protein